MHTSRHTDVSTDDYNSLHTQWKLHCCVTDMQDDSVQSLHFQGRFGTCADNVYKPAAGSLFATLSM